MPPSTVASLRPYSARSMRRLGGTIAVCGEPMCATPRASGVRMFDAALHIMGYTFFQINKRRPYEDSVVNSISETTILDDKIADAEKRQPFRYLYRECPTLWPSQSYYW